MLVLGCAACGASPDSGAGNGKDSTDHVETTAVADPDDDAGPPTTIVAVDAGVPVWTEDDASAPPEPGDDAGVGGGDCDDDAGVGGGRGGHGGDVDAGPPTEIDAGL